MTEFRVTTGVRRSSGREKVVALRAYTFTDPQQFPFMSNALISGAWWLWVDERQNAVKE